MEHFCLSLSSFSSLFISSSSSPLLLPRFRAPPRLRSRRLVVVAAGRSKKKSKDSEPQVGIAALLRKSMVDARRKAQKRQRRRSLRPRRDPKGDLNEEELQMVGLGYDRWVRFLSPDSPHLRHPHDWYKYGRHGPYAWRGIVVGPCERGLMSDNCVSMLGEVRDIEEFEKKERVEMASEYNSRIKSFHLGSRFYWVFVRHPKWDRAAKPWEQWTIAAEVAVEAPPGERLDKWSLMGRLGNRARRAVTRCAAWVRPDIIYVDRPVYQCRFEPQDGFFRPLGPLLDPRTEGRYLFDLKDAEGRLVDRCTYFGGLCKIVRIRPKAFVDDVVRAYEKLDDEGKSRCLAFLLENHPMELLHPYTREWKAKLEEMELGCDAPDDSDGEGAGAGDSEKEVIDWLEVDEDGTCGEAEQDNGEGEFRADDDDDEEEEEEEDGEEEELDTGDEYDGEEEEDVEGEEDDVNDIEDLEEQLDATMPDHNTMSGRMGRENAEAKGQGMDREVASVERGMATTVEKKGDEGERRPHAHSGEAWEAVGYRKGARLKIIKSKIPPELFLWAAVRPFTYRNLVKEIVLMRHAIIDGDIDPLG